MHCAFYMAPLSAVRYDAIHKDSYLKLRVAGKPPKVALVAGTRKLVVLMNRQLKNPQFQLAKWTPLLACRQTESSVPATTVSEDHEADT